MAIFSNQATLTYNGNLTNSNIAYGEILDVLAVTKTSVEGSYTPGSLVTYAVTLRNTGTSTLSGLTVTDNLGGYDFGGTTVYPLTYESNSAVLFVNGVPQGAPSVTAGPPLVISGLSVPGGGDAVLSIRHGQTPLPILPWAVRSTIPSLSPVTGSAHPLPPRKPLPQRPPLC